MVKVYDSMGEMKVSGDAYYGASTQRALENFPVSGHTMPAPMSCLSQVKIPGATPK